MAYNKTTWENAPSTNTPINAGNLNKIEEGIYQNSLKADQVGDLSELETINKTSIVNAINELKDGEIYSTSEVKTNKVWIDNKPIYRKVVDLGPLGTQTQISYGNQIDTITSFGGYLYQDNGGNMSLIEYTSSLWRAITYTVTSNHTMNVLINRSNTSAWNDWKLKIVIEYTKTS